MIWVVLTINLLLDIVNTFNVADWATLNLSFMSIEFD